MRNQVARHMNTFNKNSVHKDLRKASLLDDDYFVEEGFIEYSEKDEEQVMPTPVWLQNLKSNAEVLKDADKTIPCELLDKYKKDCISLLPPNSVLSIEQKPGDETNPIHLIWMLQQIKDNTEMSQTKRHRWLGYIQGVLVMKGVFSVEEEREYTRPIFNGA